MARPWSSAPTRATSRGRGRCASRPRPPAPGPRSRGARPRPQSRPGCLARALPASLPGLVLATRASGNETGRRTDMARIAGVNLPNQKRLEVGLTYIYGIGPSTARRICAALGLSQDTKVRDLTDEEVTKL